MMAVCHQDTSIMRDRNEAGSANQFQIDEDQNCPSWSGILEYDS